MVEGRLAREIAGKIVELNNLIMAQAAERGTVNPEIVTLAADLRSYFVYTVLDCQPEEALELSVLLDTLGTLAHYGLDPFDAGFFTALSKMVSSKHEEEGIRRSWEERFAKTLEKLQIGRRESSDAG